jgi:hypothetical protein
MGLTSISRILFFFLLMGKTKIKIPLKTMIFTISRRLGEVPKIAVWGRIPKPLFLISLTVPIGIFFQRPVQDNDQLACFGNQHFPLKYPKQLLWMKTPRFLKVSGCDEWYQYEGRKGKWV